MIGFLTKSEAVGLCVVVLLASACAPPARQVEAMPFESMRWQRDYSVFEYDTRERMAIDLVRSRSLIGLARSEVVAQLGKTGNTAREPLGNLKYEIREDYGSDIDPIGGAFLVVEFGARDVVTNVRIEEWKQ